MRVTGDLLDYLDKAKTADLNNAIIFSQMVRDGRKLSGLSIRQTADQIRVSLGTIDRWERGRNLPHLVIRQTVTRFFFDQISNMLAQVS